MADKDLKKKLQSKYTSKGDGSSGQSASSMDLNVRRACEKDGLDAVDWYIYFGDINPGKARCSDCYEHRNELCAGGKDPVQCMKEGRARMRLRMAR